MHLQTSIKIVDTENKIWSIFSWKQNVTLGECTFMSLISGWIRTFPFFCVSGILATDNRLFVTLPLFISETWDMRWPKRFRRKKKKTNCQIRDRKITCSNCVVTNSGNYKGGIHHLSKYLCNMEQIGKGIVIHSQPWCINIWIAWLSWNLR